MDHNSVDEFSRRLQDLRVQRNLTEVAIEEITQESARVEYNLRVTRSTIRRGKQDTGTEARPHFIKKN